MAGGARRESVAAKLHLPEECLAQSDCRGLITDHVIQFARSRARHGDRLERPKFAAFAGLVPAGLICNLVLATLVAATMIAAARCVSGSACITVIATATTAAAAAFAAATSTARRQAHTV